VSSINRNEQLLRDYIEQYVAGLERWRATSAGPGSRLTVVGDISGQLLLTGNVRAALEVEHLWNDLTRTLPFLTVCSFGMEMFSDDTDADVLSELCAEHFAVAHTPEGATRSLF